MQGDFLSDQQDKGTMYMSQLYIDLLCVPLRDEWKLMYASVLPWGGSEGIQRSVRDAITYLAELLTTA